MGREKKITIRQFVFGTVGTILLTAITQGSLDRNNIVATMIRHPAEDCLRDSIMRVDIDNKVNNVVFLKELKNREKSNYAIADRFKIVEGTQRELIISSAKQEATLNSILRELQKIYMSKLDDFNPCDTSESATRVAYK